MPLKSLAVGVAILATVSMWQVRAGPEPGTKQEGSRDTSHLLKHGDYLVNAVALCGDCHTPQDDRGKLDRTRRLRGATLRIRPKEGSQPWAEESPDITGGGLAGRWREAEMVKFLTTGIAPDGETAMPPMPAFRLNAEDARAVSLYLKSIRDQGEKEGKDSE